MKKTILLSSTLLLTALLSAGVKEAEAETTEPFNTKATFNFGTEDPENTDPNDPVDKDKPVGPETGQKGLLTIDAVSDFNFKSAKITGGETKTTAEVPDGKTVGIQVTDKRGTGAGWNVQAKVDEFKDTKEATKILKGATIKVPAGTFKTTVNGDTTNPPKAANAEGTLIGKSATPILRAEKDQGKGSWVNDWADQVELTIPGGNLLGNYQATVTWTLINTPTGNN
ncbi:hypothetical protein UAW_03009 [Enterococcus haemoperoxidus ATCC BAA-382]|uniref:WxL domain-containing protein n=1 Tax=Enterococcus haemoperoxidus ATCC BAA-382 TaxID=1158608 RepID=R2SWS3_9ENTE|nr:WxL domain-containing protein [Enterococcus haemoperoxidus]EOH92489.1 hypothetical protein UAW_03009 [Enterococcus haemoperoxidus ATCC BAA-382]EOT61710.1 hypothetical protein I583_00692 [Enterococcus haemoperoxidus ATCC BAA-382]OJG51824.1 hypothetical protein RV06_GL001516 [Enterococcus haemoperoxidus]